MTTISDVARAAGVSPATVSRVLNQPDTVVADKRQRVLAAIAELDYQPSAAARGLRRGTFQTLALLVGDIAQPFHGRLAKAVQRAAETKGYSVLLGDLDHQHSRLVTLLRSLPARGVDGVIIATADNLDVAPVRSALTELGRRGISVVTASQRIPSLNVPAITSDYSAAAYDATTHLLNQGRWPIAFLGGGRSSMLSHELRDGYEAACRAANHDPDPTLILDGRFDPELAARVTAVLFDQGIPLQGLVALNIPMALGAMSTATDHGLAIPDQLAVVVCEDVPLASHYRPTLTSISIDFDALARHAVDALTPTAPSGDIPTLTLMPHRLIVRQSSAAVPVQPRRRSRPVAEFSTSTGMPGTVDGPRAGADQATGNRGGHSKCV